MRNDASVKNSLALNDSIKFINGKEEIILLLHRFLRTQISDTNGTFHADETKVFSSAKVFLSYLLHDWIK